MSKQASQRHPGVIPASLTWIVVIHGLERPTTSAHLGFSIVLIASSSGARGTCTQAFNLQWDPGTVSSNITQ